MKATRLFNWALMAAITFGLGAAVTACSDDDDKNESKTEREADTVLNTDEGQAATRILSALANVTELPTDWRTKTYAPDFGTESATTAGRRIVIVADMDEAKLKFASLADCDPAVLAGNYTATIEDMGTLKWEPSDRGERLALVTVSLRQMPTLSDIVYCTQDQLGNNGLFSSVKGTTYYRFGDVVKDSEGYLWVCVRPAFEENDKEDSHWMNIINYTAKPMAAANQETKWNNGKWKKDVETIILPTKLGCSYEHNINLGQLIYAMLDPTKYTSAAATAGKGLGGFSYSHHNADFVQYVSDKWESKGLFKSFFNKTRSELKNLRGLRFYYNGYSWGLFAGNNATLWLHNHDSYLATLPSGSESKEKVTYDMTQGFDVTRYTGNPNAAKVCHEQFDNNYGYYVVRYAKGKALCSVGSYGYDRKLGGCDDVYRYYADFGIDVGTTLAEAEAKEKENQAINIYDSEVGQVVTWEGHIYKNYSNALRANEEPAAVIVRYDVSSERNEKGSMCPILAIWHTCAHDKSSNIEMVWGPTGVKSGATVLDNSSTTFQATALTLVDGLSNTTTLRSKDGYTAAQACWNLAEWTYIGALPERGNLVKQPFLPSVGQYLLMLKGLGVYDKMSDGAAVIEAINKAMTNANSAGTWTFPTDGTPVWTSTEASDDEAYVFIVDQKLGARFEKRSKQEKHRVYPFLLVG